MPPKARTFWARKENTLPVVAGDDRYDGDKPPPILSVSVGTAGYKRSWNWARRMGEAGVLSRVQALMIYDCNQGTINSIESEADQLRRLNRRNYGRLPIILPDYFPKVDGFLRDPNAFKDFYGLIDRDLDRMVEEAAKRAESVSAPPQVIIEWLGFGGHAKLGGLLHRKLVEQFPEALILPVVLLPREHALEENMRRETWGAYEETMVRDDVYGNPEPGFPALLTDNRKSRNYAMLDNRLTIGLASIEAAMQYQTDSGSLAETVASFGPYANGWMGMRVLNRRIDVASVKQEGGLRRLLPGNRRTAIVKGKDNHITWQIKNAMWEMLDIKRTDLQMADHSPIEDESIIRMVITIPANAGDIHEIENDVRDQLDREGYEQAFPNLTFSFAPSYFPTSNGEHHMYISMLYPLRDPNILSIQRIMGKSDVVPRYGENHMLQVGFGTHHFMPSSGAQSNGHAEFDIRTNQHSYLSRGHLRRSERETIRRTTTAEPPTDGVNGNGYNGNGSADNPAGSGGYRV